MIRFPALLTTVLCLILPPTIAQGAAPATQPVVIELFASQNCPACPKAHKTMTEVAATQSDVLILTWSVDYWDYLGAPDPMAIPDAKARQAAYAENLGLRAPYTPQSVYNGVKECPGPQRRNVLANIASQKQRTRPAPPELTRTDEGIVVSGKTDTTLDIYLIDYLSGDANLTTMTNPVIAANHIGTWSGAPLTVKPTCSQTCVLILQSPHYGEIIAVKPL